MNCKVYQGDCRDVLKELIAQGIQVDSIVTDPPYELGFMGKGWDKTGIATDVEMWKLALQVLKPGGHLLAFGGSRTYHRMASAIEDSGFEIRDQIMWIYGQGFPKSLDISKAIDKKAGLERGKLGFHEVPDLNPVSDLAKQWQGWGTGLKPAHEPIVMARKPISEKTIAENVVVHGTGAINIDGSRVGFTKGEQFEGLKDPFNHISQGEGPSMYGSGGVHCTTQYKPTGRFPANLIHDGSEEVEEEFAKYGVSYSSGGTKASDMGRLRMGCTTGGGLHAGGLKDRGTASRFFYCAKASKKDRQDSKHPTVKPIALMRYLCKLITPPEGIVLDPFAGTGTTGEAAHLEGFEPILIEKDVEYIADINRRVEAMEFKLRG